MSRAKHTPNESRLAAMLKRMHTYARHGDVPSVITRIACETVLREAGFKLPRTNLESRQQDWIDKMAAREYERGFKDGVKQERDAIKKAMGK